MVTVINSLASLAPVVEPVAPVVEPVAHVVEPVAPVVEPGCCLCLCFFLQ